MPSGKYPEHDINQVFDFIEVVLSSGGVADNAMDEMTLLNRLFSALPVQAVEYGMQFLHGKRDLPASCDEILPLYIRFVNLIDYCETIVKMRNIPSHPTPEELQERVKMNSLLNELEKPFCTPLLGFSLNKDKKLEAEETPSEPSEGSSENSSSDDSSDVSGSESTSNLHLMNDCAPVFICADAVKTALFYETQLGFSVAHLDDETMPHILLHRDNIHIILVQAKEGTKISTTRELYGIPYDLYIYVSEPMMLQMELQSANVKIVKTLEESDATTTINREFVFEDLDGRHICVSHRA